MEQLRRRINEAAERGVLSETQARRVLALGSEASAADFYVALVAEGVSETLASQIVPPPGAEVETSGAIGISLPLPAGFRRVGPYELVRELGRGAHGVVYEARDASGRGVALKVLSRTSAHALRRFEKEARALSAFEHPNVVRFVGAAVAPVPYLALELVDGANLEDLLEAGCPPDELAAILADVALGLAHVHRAGIVHRDVKPTNVMVRADGRAVVTDFGLVKDVASAGSTVSGTFVGTPAYAAPEQVHGLELGPAADVWGLGATLYRGLTGRPPFEGQTVTELFARIEEGKVAPPRALAPGVPRDLEATCLACLERDPARRPTALEVAGALRLRRPLRGPRGGKSLPVAVALVVVVALAAVVVALARGPRPAAGPSWRALWTAASIELDPAAAPLVGRATRKGDRVLVERDLGRLASGLVRSPGRYFSVANGPPVVFEGGLLAIAAPPDGGVVRWAAGDAWWKDTSAELAFTLRGGRARTLTIALGDEGAQRLQLDGRAGTVTLGEATAAAPLAPGEPHVVTFAPGHDRGRRVVLDGKPLDALDAVAGALVPGGPVFVDVEELAVAIERATIEGVPLRPDRPAWRVSPGPTASTAARVTAVVTADPSRGGPFVGLGTPDREPLALEVTRDRVVLRHGRAVLDDAPWRGAPGKRLELALERQGDLVRGVATFADGPQVLVQAVEPLPLELPWHAILGAAGSPARFERVLFEEGPDDPDRAAFDRAPDAGDRARPVVAHRHGALLFARSRDPSATVPDRVAAAANARDLLASAAADLRDPARRQDALARAVHAGVVAGDARAVDAARHLLASEPTEQGRSSARRKVDALERDEGRPCLIDRLVTGYVRLADRRVIGPEAALARAPVARAAASAAAVLAPDRRGEALFTEAKAVEMRIDPEAADARERFAEVVALFEAAQAAGYPLGELAPHAGVVLLRLGEYERALARWEVAVIAHPESWFAWSSRARALLALGRRAEAIESLLGGLVAARTNARLHAELESLLPGAGPGLAGAILQALADAAGEPAGSERRRAALDLARRARADDRDGDLALYVRARGDDAVEPGTGDRPTLALVRAREALAAGRDGWERSLAEAARRDRLVEHLARLDPELSRAKER